MKMKLLALFVTIYHSIYMNLKEFGSVEFDLNAVKGGPAMNEILQIAQRSGFDSCERDYFPEHHSKIVRAFTYACRYGVKIHFTFSKEADRVPEVGLYLALVRFEVTRPLPEERFSVPCIQRMFADVLTAIKSGYGFDCEPTIFDHSLDCHIRNNAGKKRTWDLGVSNCTKAQNKEELNRCRSGFSIRPDDLPEE